MYCWGLPLGCLLLVLALSAATFYSRHHGLRSTEQTNPPNPFHAVIGKRRGH